MHIRFSKNLYIDDYDLRKNEDESTSSFYLDLSDFFSIFVIENKIDKDYVLHL